MEPSRLLQADPASTSIHAHIRPRPKLMLPSLFAAMGPSASVRACVHAFTLAYEQAILSARAPACENGHVGEYALACPCWHAYMSSLQRALSKYLFLHEHERRQDKG
eukprot:5115823-Pleurochrysis_carterae.AAC.1